VTPEDHADTIQCSGAAPPTPGWVIAPLAPVWEGQAVSTARTITTQAWRIGSEKPHPDADERQRCLHLPAQFAR
jgi:hypothetical protein